MVFPKWWAAGGADRPEAEGWPGGLRSGPEDVVPIVVGRAKALDGLMAGDHGAGHGVTGGVGIEAAVDLAALVQEGGQAARVRPGTGGGEAPVRGMEGQYLRGRRWLILLLMLFPSASL